MRYALVSEIKEGDYITGPEGRPEQVKFPTAFAGVPQAILAPDNVYGMVDLTQIAIPAGYERIAYFIHDWFRCPTFGEWFMNICSMPEQALNNFFISSWEDKRRIILKKKTSVRRYLVARAGTDNVADFLGCRFEYKNSNSVFLPKELVKVEEVEE